MFMTLKAAPLDCHHNQQKWKFKKWTTVLGFDYLSWTFFSNIFDQHEK